MQHTNREGKPKILKKCTLPLTGLKVVDTIVTELALLRVTPAGLRIDELAPGVTVDDVQKVTEAKLLVADSIQSMFG